MIRRHYKTYRRWRSPTEHTHQLMQSLLALYQLLRTPQSLDMLLQAILDTAIDCVPGAQRGSLVVREGTFFRYRAMRGYDFEKLRAVRFPAEQILNILPEGQRGTQLVSYDQWNADYLETESYKLVRKYGDTHLIRRSMISSIFVGGKFFGTLVLDNLHSYAHFPPTSEATAMLLAEQAGAVIEHAQLLEQLRHTHSLLAETEKSASLGRLVAGVAHEINNPLTAVLGYTELLQLEELSDDALDAITQIRVGAERMRGVVRNLQIFARQQQHGQGEVDLSALIMQILALKKTDLTFDQITVERDLGYDLPPIWGDAGALSQVLLNLVNNAQYVLRTKPLPRLLRVRTWFEAGSPASPPHLGVAVCDNGPGMAPDILPRIFEPFFTTKPLGQGTGLGLSVCYGIIADHSGQIWAESQLGQGTTMHVRLPVRPTSSTNSSAEPGAEAQRPMGLRVLLLDDDDLVVRLVRGALVPGNEVVAVGDGRAGLQALAHGAFDLILCDLKMPVMRGDEFFYALAEHAHALQQRVLFISGDTSNIASYDFLATVDRPLLAKPFTPAELYRAIHAMACAPS